MTSFASTVVVGKVKDYDYYGAYDIKRNQQDKYNELLGKEYTFDFPPHHDVVRVEPRRRDMT